MMNDKYLVFDMDGTIADLYGVNNWLKDLHNENTRPYEVAKPMYDKDVCNVILSLLAEIGYHVVVTTWLAKDASSEYDKAVAKAKETWLKEHNFPAEKVYCVPYGTPKHDVTKHLGGFQILIDDNADVRKDWDLGITIAADKENIWAELTNLLYGEF